MKSMFQLGKKPDPVTLPLDALDGLRSGRWLRGSGTEAERRNARSEAAVECCAPRARRKLFRIPFYAAWFAIWGGLIGRPAFPDAA